MTEQEANLDREPIRLGRYALFDELASGGMATVHLGRLLGPVGFSRTVAIKRLHPQHAKDSEFVTMLLDEARLAARIRHPNVVATLDVVATEGEVFLVMEYVEGESLSYVTRICARRPSASLRTSRRTSSPERCTACMPPMKPRATTVSRSGSSTRGVPPQNILIGIDGVPRVLDFGVAKAAGRLQTTDQGRIKGKLGYMAPEQLAAKPVLRKTDIFAAGIVLWEALTGERLFRGEDPAEIVGKVLNAPIMPTRELAPDIPESLDAVVMRALARRPEQRFDTALEMAEAIEAATGLVAARKVGNWLKEMLGARLDERAAKVAEVESISSVVDNELLGSSDIDSGRASAAMIAARATTAQQEQPLQALESGSGVSRVGSVIDSSSTKAKRRPWWLPYAVGAATVMIPAALILASSRHGEVESVATSAAPGPASVPVTTSAALPAPESAAPSPVASASAGKPPTSASSAAAEPSASAPKPSASAKPKRVRPRYARPRHKATPHPKPIDTTSLYSRQ